MGLENVLRMEREQSSVDCNNLLSQIIDLVMKQGAVQDQRLEEKMSEIQTTIRLLKDSFEMARAQYIQS